MTLQLYGLYRSGTNYLAWLVQANLGAEVRHGQKGKNWKHGPPKKTKARGYLLITKDPLAWLASRQRYRPAPVDQLCREYNTRGWQFVHFAARQDALLIRYEDLLTDLSGQIDRIVNRFGLRRTSHPAPFDQPRTMKRGGDEWLSYTEELFDRSYYLEERYLNDVPDGYDFDDELLERLGYAVHA